MKQIILTLAAVALSLSAAFNAAGQSFEYDGLKYSVLSAADKTVTCNGLSDKYIMDVKVPETVSYEGVTYTVTSVGDYGFSGYPLLLTVELPNTVTSLGERAFYQCERLESVKLPDGLKEIPESCFYSCYDLRTVNIPEGVTTIGYRAFSDCSSLSSVTIPESVVEIGSYAFSEAGLQSVEIPGGVRILNESTFAGCENLKSVILHDGLMVVARQAFESSGIQSIDIPDTVRLIEEMAFAYCGYLEEVDLPTNIDSIEDGLFGYTGLTSITVPNKVDRIGGGAFSNCYYLMEINVENAEPPVIEGSNISGMPGCFYEVNKDDCVLNVPVGSLEAYKSAEEWKWFKNIQEKDFGGVDGVENDSVSVTAKGGSIEIGGADNARVEVYNLSGQLVHSGTETTVGGLARGIYIVRVAGQTFKIAL